jgi:hypothetical protein
MMVAAISYFSLHQAKSCAGRLAASPWLGKPPPDSFLVIFAYFLPSALICATKNSGLSLRLPDFGVEIGSTQPSPAGAA